MRLLLSPLLLLLLLFQCVLLGALPLQRCTPPGEARSRCSRSRSGSGGAGGAAALAAVCDVGKGKRKAMCTETPLARPRTRHALTVPAPLSLH